ncbi:hypothetical protein [Parvibaculum sp.]|uniref:hypothetical protein n=1 Tax=Parvibaculum sp. TaxID=2024848 RepID=UPI00391CD8CD
MSGRNLFAILVLAVSLPLAAQVRAQDAGSSSDPVDGLPPFDDVQYELSDPVGSPPVNYRSGYDPEYDTPELHNAEMYAEEYERRKQEEQIKAREQIDRINNFSSGAVTTDGVIGPRY